MAKLPDNFVKPPPASSRLTAAKTTAAKLGRRTRKADALEAEAIPHVHSVMVRLSPEEHQALSTACEALVAVGHTISIEDMIKQVVVRWIVATRAMQGAALPAPARSAIAAAPIRAQLRRLAAQPLRRWHEIGQTLRRWQRSLELGR